jgi:hypothetical protein
MDFQFDEREESLRKEIREFAKAELPADWAPNAIALVDAVHEAGAQ